MLAKLLRQSLHRILLLTHQAPWMRFASSLQSGDPRSNERIDEVVLGEEPCMDAAEPRAGGTV